MQFWVRFKVGLLALLACGLNTALAQQRYVGVEVGSRGVKFILVEAAVQNGQTQLSILKHPEGKDEVKNSGLNDSASVTQRYSQQAIDETVAAIKGYVDDARALMVPDENIFIVGSSGVRTARNQTQFMAAVLEQTSLPINFISHYDEVALAFLDVTLQADADATQQVRHESLSLDIGSGNTKFGYTEFSADRKSWVPNAEQIIWGTATFRDAIKGQLQFTDASNIPNCIAEFAAAAAAQRTARNIDSSLASKIDELDTIGRDRVYFSGGIVWAMVTLLHPESMEEPEVNITPEDIEQFAELVLKPVDDVFASPDLSMLSDEARAKAEKEIGTVRKVFASPKDDYPVAHADLIAGAQLLLASSRNFDFTNRTVLFPRNSLTSWIRSYVRHNVQNRDLEPAAVTMVEEAITPPTPMPTPSEPATPLAGSVVSDAAVAQLTAQVQTLTAGLGAIKQDLVKLEAIQNGQNTTAKELEAMRKTLNQLTASQQKMEVVLNQLSQRMGATLNAPTKPKTIYDIERQNYRVTEPPYPIR